MDYIFPGIFGLLVGAVLYGLTYQWVFPQIARVANFGNITLPVMWKVNPLLLVAVFVVFVLLLFYMLERGLQRKDRLEE
ncbi:MAG: hypothetical protein MUO76_04575 [Anaerolineaceae bacterium]|nr:hypothetical protein [Anaerolineaceae bacterium]